MIKIITGSGRFSCRSFLIILINLISMFQRQLSFGEAVKKVLVENYCNFTGRASRSEFWWYTLFTAIVGFAIGFILGIFGAGQTTVQIFQCIIGLVLLLPGLGVAIRRLHDIGKSGWWILLGLIPLVGAIVLLIWYCKDSQGDNEYGDEPNMVD